MLVFNVFNQLLLTMPVANSQLAKPRVGLAVAERLWTEGGKQQSNLPTTVLERERDEAPVPSEAKMSYNRFYLKIN